MTLNIPVIRLLVAKDWQLFQKQLAFYVLAGIVALCFLGLAKPWAFYIGSLMLIIVTVSVACFSISTSLMTERKEKTLAFVMSLPVSPLDFTARLVALVKFLALTEASSLTAANKRISNILKKAEGGAGGTVDVTLLREPAERALHEAVAGIVTDVTRALDQRDYREALTRLAVLRPTVDAFFDGVMVNAEDPTLRRNRLALLAGLRGLFARIADLSYLPG